MLHCAYCDDLCEPTREHVIPRWYNDTPGDAETFSARAPMTHRRGDLIVRDVCRNCNNGELAHLDAYGKELYDRYFANPVYADESVTFEYDCDRLLRWLLKLSYNSARAQNSDTRILREYRNVILGRDSIPNRVRCWVSLVSPSNLSDGTVARAATSAERGQPDIDEPLWFRLVQFRLQTLVTYSLVQRQVIVNSFAFTLLIASPNSEWPLKEFEQWVEAYTTDYPNAEPIVPGTNVIEIKPAGDHVITSIFPLAHHYPARFLDEANPYIEQALKNQLNIVFLNVPHELLVTGDTTPIASALRDMVSTREKASAFKQRIGVLVDGFDDDPRALWQVPEARRYFRRLFIECPFVMLLAHSNGGLLKLMAACWVYEDSMTEEIRKQRTSDFLLQAFAGLNTITHTLAMSEEANREISEAAARSLYEAAPDGPA